MKAWIAALAAVVSMGFVVPANAQVDSHGDGVAVHNSIGLGFHSVEAPLGLRWWFSGQKVAIDLGFGMDMDEVNDLAVFGPGIETNETVTGYTIEAGVPFVIRSWPKVHILLRPGLLFSSQEIPFDSDPLTAGIQFDTENETRAAGRLEVEGEAFLADNFSVSAALGVEFASFTPADFPGGGDSESATTFGTVGSNFTNIGFHMYLWGGGR